MLPLAYLHHHLQGRSRLKIPAKAGDRAFFAEISERLKRHPAVQTVRTSSATGSVLVHHEGAVDAITAFAKEKGLFAFSKTAETVRMTGSPDPADPALILSLGFAGLECTG